MMREDFRALRGIVELDAFFAFTCPVQEELSGGFADPVLAGADLDIKGGGGREPEGFLDIGYGADEEPAALVE